MYRSYSPEIPVDSLLMKMSACVPVFGVIPTIMATALLDEQLKDRTFGNNHKIRVLDLKNHYRIASIIRDMIGLAFIIKVIAVGVLTTQSVFWIAIIAASIIWHVHTINEHNLLIERIQQVSKHNMEVELHH